MKILYLGETKNPKKVQNGATFKVCFKSYYKVLSKLFFSFIINKSALRFLGNFKVKLW